MSWIDKRNKFDVAFATILSNCDWNHNFLIEEISCISEEEEPAEWVNSLVQNLLETFPKKPSTYQLYLFVKKCPKFSDIDPWEDEYEQEDLLQRYSQNYAYPPINLENSVERFLNS